MNIEKWDIERIMQLPDWCFGRRWQVSADVWASNGNFSFDMSEDAYPDWIVLWFVYLHDYYAQTADEYMRIALGHQVPTTEAEFMKCVPLLRGFGRPGPDPRKIHLYFSTPGPYFPLRQPIYTQGRRLIALGYAAPTKYIRVHVITVISSVPKEVPDWLFSGRAALLS